MNKSKALRVGGFVVAVAASAALIGAATGATGAYFTDSSQGQFTGSSGNLHITTQNTYFSFAGLNPGQDQHQVITYQLSGTTPADIWFVFDTSTQAGRTAYCDFTGATTDSNCTNYPADKGGLGMYGHFKVQGPSGSFESYNLALQQATDAEGGYSTVGDNPSFKCLVNANGWYGSAQQHVVGSVYGAHDIAQCGAPHAILLQTSMQPGTGNHATITFGLTGKQTQQNQSYGPVPFKIVATQPGVSPIGTNW